MTASRACLEAAEYRTALQDAFTLGWQTRDTHFLWRRQLIQALYLGAALSRTGFVLGRGWFLADELDEIATGVVENRDDRLADVGGRLCE